MASAMIAVLLALWSMSLQSATADMSTNEANYLAAMNGYYDNLDQFQKDNTSYDYVQLTYVPVTTPALPDRVVLYNEWSFNGKVFNMQLCDVTEDARGKVHLALYNFTDPSPYKPGQFKVNDLSNLTPDNLQTPSTCESEFESDGLGGFMGSWPACRHYINGKPALYGFMGGCNAIRVIIPNAAPEAPSTMPYNLYLKGDKYPVPGFPDGLANPCN